VVGVCFGGLRRPMSSPRPMPTSLVSGRQTALRNFAWPNGERLGGSLREKGRFTLVVDVVELYQPGMDGCPRFESSPQPVWRSPRPHAPTILRSDHPSTPPTAVLLNALEIATPQAPSPWDQAHTRIVRDADSRQPLLC
jgi:hypothetical protein